MVGKNNHTVFRTLEFDTILERVSGLTVSVLGRERVLRLSPLTEADVLEKELGRVTEMRDLMAYDDPFPLHGFEDLRPYLETALVVGAFLQPREILEIKRFLTMIRQAKAYFVGKEEKYPLLDRIGGKIASLPELEKAIDRVVDPSAEVKDRASDTLWRLRKELGRLTSQVRKRLEAILRSMVSQGYAQEDTLVLREGRLVVPVKEPHRNQLRGVVVDQSSSGATLFVEPVEVLELNNDIRRIKIQERQEVERILKALTDRVRENAPEIEVNLRVAGELDCLSARARLAVEMDAKPAQISEDDVLDLKDARHPLLLMREGGTEVVPLSLRLGGAVKTLVITGPNAGGKTVALKTVGLLSLMHQSGLPVPAEEGTMFPVFSAVFADIGDQQSIEQDLSTFSSHVGNIKKILESTDAKSLVLLDEIGSATDPAEGGALATVVLRNLTRRGCLTVATTHIGSLKIFAHEEPGVENGSMAFDHETLRPTYRFRMGIPGSSYAFEIAGRLGVSKKIVGAARKLVGEEGGSLDRLILRLEEEMQRTHSLLEEAEIKESKLAGLVKLYEEKIDRLHEESEARKQEILEEAEEVLRQANAAVERVVREIRERQAERETVRAVKETIKTQRKRIKDLSQPKARPDVQPLHPGDWVVWQGHGGRGEVISEPDKTGRVLVQWNGVKVKIPVQELEPVAGSEHRKSPRGATNYRVEREVGDEIDIRGMTVEEAVEVVDRYLGDVAMTGFAQIRVIHGKGTGVLRREIGKYLKKHPLVKDQRLGSWNEGDTGVTIVELK